MADIELVIKIDEKDYKAILNTKKNAPYNLTRTQKIIINGTPLPEHHSDLIERSVLLDNVQDYGEGQCKLMLLDPYYVRRAKTIIPATKEGEQK